MNGLCNEVGTPNQFTTLELNMFTDMENPLADPPCLQGHAAESRHLVPVLYRVFREVYRPGVVFEVHILQVLYHLVKI